jgi:hypothetical protein
MSCGCLNHAKLNIDGLSVGPSEMFYQNHRRLRNILSMLFTFCVDFDGWSITTVDSLPPLVCTLGSCWCLTADSLSRGT